MASNDPNQGARGLLGRKGNRLPSLKGPRDLTLGGVQKKTFTPNIPARPRDRKDKDDTDEGTSDKSGGERKKRHEGHGDRGRGGRGRGRGRGRGEPNVIQSHSIFEQGPLEGVRKTTGSWGGGGDSGDRVGGSRASGGPIKREKGQADDTKRVLDDILRDDFISERRREADPNMMPIKLPVTSRDVKPQVKEDIKPKIKAEPLDDESSSHSVPDVEMKNEGSVKSESPEPGSDAFRPATAAELFKGAAKTDRGEFIFIQLPDALPGDPSGREADPRNAAADKNRSKPDQTNASQDSEVGAESAEEAELARRLGLFHMAQFSEGYIGKIQVHKSGRTRLVLGDVALDVSLGATPGFLQDLVSVQLSEDKSAGDLAVLGHVTHKLNCVPDFDAMLNT